MSDFSQSKFYRAYLLIALSGVLAYSSVDRLALGLVLPDIKADLELTDSQLGLLTGIAFAFFYALAGLPLARWADRGNRVSIISLTTALWAGAVALSGGATSFIQLLAIRVCVAVGEAGLMPAAHSLIADHFSRAERPRALATYLLGAPISVLLGYMAAGYLAEAYSWRVTFVVLGLPGVLIALLLWLTLRDPRARKATPELAAPTAASTGPGLLATFGQLWANVAFRNLVICFSIVAFFNAGISQWKPSFFARSYGMGMAEMGVWFTLVYGLGSVIGIWLGGEWASRFAPRNERKQLAAAAVMLCLLTAASIATYVVQDRYAAFALVGVTTLGTSAVGAPMFAAIQTIVSPAMRAMSVAIIYLFANLVGHGFGPFAAGIISDSFSVWAAGESLRYALLTLSPGFLFGAYFMWRASKSIQGYTDAESNPSESVGTR